MNKIIIVFGLFLILIAGIAYYQFSKNKGMQTTGTATIGEHKFAIEVVRDAKAQQIGLIKYNGIKDDQGMLFLFTQPGRYGFWMRNMKFPIDIIFINGEKVVSLVENVKPVNQNEPNPPIYSPSAPADKVLEINAGLVKKYSIKQGDTVKFEIK